MAIVKFGFHLDGDRHGRQSDWPAFASSEVAVEEAGPNEPRKPLLGRTIRRGFRLFAPAGDPAFFLLPTMPAAPFPAALNRSTCP